MGIRFRELLELVENYSRGRNYKVFLVFVMISTFFWLLIKFSKQYTAIVKFPVEYIAIPKGVVWEGEHDEVIEMSATASGFQHLSYALWGDAIEIDLSGLRSLDDDQYYILPKHQMTKIIQQFPSNLVLVYQDPDTIFFDLSKKITKKVPVVLRDSLVLAKSFQFTGKRVISPDSVIISGQASVVSEIEQVETVLYTKRNIRKPLKDRVKIQQNIDSRVEVSNSYVDVFVGVEQFTQISIDVPIAIENVPAGFLLKTFPDNVIITFNTGLSNVEGISDLSFRVIADYNKLTQGKAISIPLDVVVLTDKVEVIRVEPKSVEFLLRKID